MNACQTKESASNTEADKAAIRKVADEALSMVTRINKDNASELVKFFYAEDAVVFPPNALPLKGHEAIIGLLQTYPPMTDYIQKPEEIVVLSNFAYQWDTWSVTLPLAGQTSFKDTGTVFWIWHKQDDGAWKLWREIWHSDLPVTSNPSTPNQ